MPELRILCKNKEAFMGDVYASYVVGSDGREVLVPPGGFIQYISPDSLVPSMPHRLNSDRDPTEAIRAMLTTEPATAHPRSTLEIVRLPEETIDYAYQCYESPHNPPEPPEQLAHILGATAARFLTIDSSYPRLLTATHDPITDRYIGLHLDNAFNQPLSEREDSPRRLTVNLGPGTRWLLAIVPDGITIARELNSPADQPIRTGTVVWPYAQNPHRLANMTCLWIPYEPGEGYFGPTERLVHDVSTLMSDKPSDVAFWLEKQWAVGLAELKY